jgi:hypothetical protein
MKNIAESLSNRLDQVGKRISELEDRCFWYITIETKKERKKGMKERRKKERMTERKQEGRQLLRYVRLNE